MEGLIKGLIDVALGGGAADGDGGAETHSTPPPEQSSRSTWAEVVSSGQHGQADVEQESNFTQHSTPWTSRKENNEERSDGDWEVAGHNKKQPRRPHQVVSSRQHEQADVEQESNFTQHSAPWSSRKENSEERSDVDWEVVGHNKKQPRRPHQWQMPTDNWHAYKRPPSEQEYSDHVHHSVDTEPLREELADLSSACSRLWDLDLNRLVHGKDYETDCGEGKKVYQKGDMASGSLFGWLSDGVFRRPTFARFCSLLDNYNPDEGCKEVVTSQEKDEQTAFIEEISRSAPIKYLHKYLASKGITSESNEEFKEMMKSLWFDLYGRGGGSRSSSAFEHVFVGEIKGRGENEVTGFHNWIQFYLEEAKGKVDYQGYIFPRRHREIPNSETQLLTIQFEWNGVLKSISSILIGVSPEFEIALYTLCFFMGGEDNYVLLGPYPVNIKCYRLGNDKIGSVFPIAEC